MEINYEVFEQALSEANYEDAFHILLHMVDNLDPDSKKADARWTDVVRENLDNKSIKVIEKKFKNLPKEVKKEMENKFEILGAKNE